MQQKVLNLTNWLRETRQDNGKIKKRGKAFRGQKNKMGGTEMILLSSMALKKGEQFLQYSGEWNTLVDEKAEIIRQQLNLMIHEKTVDWLKLIKICDKKILANSCIRMHENQMVLEILNDIPENTEILAADYSQTCQEQSNTDSVLAETPLDLTWKKLNSPTEIPRNMLSLDKKPTRNTSKVQKLLQCEVCNKYFDRPSLLKRHTRTHTGEKPHICDVCQKGFSTSSSLNTHRRIHSGERPHQCSICAKRFTASSNLYYHKMTHSKEKPHKCQICGKSFPTPGNLKAHQYSHSGRWPFTCNVCGRGFGKQTNFRNHLALHGDRNL